MPTLAQSINENIRNLRAATARAAQLLAARPALLVVAIVTWWIPLVGEYDIPLAFIAIPINLVLSAAFFGVVSEVLNKEGNKISLGLIGSSIRRLTVGIVAITMVYTLPVLLGAPFLNAAVGSRLEGSKWALIVLFGPTVVPSLAAIWSLAYARSHVTQAIYDGLSLMRGRWAAAIALGIAYQALAYGAQWLRSLFLPTYLLPAGIIMVPWAVVEALFRIALLYLLFDDVPNPKPAKTRP